MTHLKFWRTMAQYFGSRWLEQYGPDPTTPWVTVLNRASAREVEAAIGLLSSRREGERGFPPTLPEFEALLRRAHARDDSDAPDYVRGYWRSCVVRELSRDICEERRIVPPSELEFYLAQHGASFGGLRGLLDELVDLEQKNGGQRTHAMHRMVVDRCRQAAAAAVEVTPLEQRRGAA